MKIVDMLTKNSLNIKIALFHLLVLGFTSATFAQDIPASYPSNYTINAIHTWEVKKPAGTLSAVTAMSNPNEALRSSEYIDGVGRVVQKVVRQQSPLQKDLVQPHVFDKYGRERQKFMQFASTASTGDFKSDPFQQHQGFYSAYLVNQFTNPWFYELVEYEPSLLNRPVETFSPGESWVGTSGQTLGPNRRSVKFKYLYNTLIDDVKKWVVTDAAQEGLMGSYSVSGIFAAQDLNKIITEDENGKQVIEFKDKEDKVLLKKVQLTAAADDGLGSGYIGWLSTYYIYDKKNNIRCIIQPEGTKSFLASGASTLSDVDILAGQCFRFEYDSRNRLIVKQVPGVNSTEMVYDQKDRLIMQRDARLAGLNYWNVTRYDVFNRVTRLELLPNTQSRSVHQSASNITSVYPATTGDIMQDNYYDNYSWIPAGVPTTVTTNDIVSAFFITAYNSAPEFAQAVTPDYTNIKGKLTGTRVRILGTATFLNTVTFYDDKGRDIQTWSKNISGAYDLTTTQYDFNGKVLRRLHRQEKGGTNPRYTRELTKYTYDHAERVTSIVKKVGFSGVDKIIVQYTYDETGKVKTKTYGNTLEVQNYDYNVRGWTLGVNRSYLTSSNAQSAKFGYEMGYDQSASILGNSLFSPAYAGNISGVIWRACGDGEKRQFKYSYDNADRLLKADFGQFNGSSFSQTAGLNFNALVGDGVNATSAYDENGNIKQLQHYGWKIGGSAMIDNLSYRYKTKSNLLLEVADQVPSATSKLGDFKDGSNLVNTNDYSYDVNGYTTSDKNKDITSIFYTHMNMPYEINIAGKGKITYAYDNFGNKLKKVIVDNTSGAAVTTTWLYMGNFVYKNDVLEFFNHEEGRARVDKTQVSAEATAFYFDYYLKDHLGNNRVVITDEQQINAYPSATLESATVTNESLYYNIDQARIRNVVDIPGANANASLNAKFYRLNGSLTNQRTGLGITLKVMAGDNVAIRAESFYNIGGGSGSSAAIPIVELLSAFIGSNPLAGKGIGSSDISSAGANATTLDNMLPSSTPSTIANAHLCWVLFNEQFEVISTGVDPVVSGGGFKAHNQFVTNPVNVTKSGYLYVFVSNKSNLDVYFDNLAVTHNRGPVTEETHYYPFGLTMAGISYKAIDMLPNRDKFSNKEFQTQEFADGTGVENYDFGARHYSPQIGRWGGVDELADKFNSLSPFNYVANNPINGIDPDGKDIIFLNDQSAAQGAGHAAVIVGNETDGWYYYSVNGTGNGSASPYGKSVNPDVGTYLGKGINDPKQLAKIANTINTSEEEPHNYDRYRRVKTTPQEDAIIKDEARKQACKKMYVIAGQSCLDVQQAAWKGLLKARLGEFAKYTPKSYSGGLIPNEWIEELNIFAADANSAYSKNTREGKYVYKAIIEVLPLENIGPWKSE